MAFSDLKGLKPEHLAVDNNGSVWIRKKRQKTKNMCNIPLLDVPCQILERYKGHPLCVKNGTVTVKNKYFFTHLDKFDIDWSVTSGEGILAQGRISDFLLAPQSEKTLSLPLYCQNPRAGQKLYFTLSFKTKKLEALVDKGHELAWEQFELPVEALAPKTVTPSSLPAMQMISQAGKTSILGEDFTIVFNDKSQKTDCFTYRGTPMLKEGPSVSLWHAPTENDKRDRNGARL